MYIREGNENQSSIFAGKSRQSVQSTDRWTWWATADWVAKTQTHTMYVYAIFCLSIHLTMSIWIVPIFWLLWIMLLWTYLFMSLLSVLLDVMAGSYENLCLIFWESAKLFHISCIILLYHQKMKKGSSFSTSLVSLGIFHSFLAIQVGVKWYLIVVFICIFLMSNNVKHLSMCLSAIWTFYLEKCFFKSIAHFWTGLVFCWALGVLCMFWILVTY